MSHSGIITSQHHIGRTSFLDLFLLFFCWLFVLLGLAAKCTARYHSVPVGALHSNPFHSSFYILLLQFNNLLSSWTWFTLFFISSTIAFVGRDVVVQIWGMAFHSIPFYIPLLRCWNLHPALIFTLVLLFLPFFGGHFCWYRSSHPDLVAGCSRPWSWLNVWPGAEAEDFVDRVLLSCEFSTELIILMFLQNSNSCVSCSEPAYLFIILYGLYSNLSEGVFSFIIIYWKRCIHT